MSGSKPEVTGSKQFSLIKIEFETQKNMDFCLSVLLQQTQKEYSEKSAF